MEIAVIIAGKIAKKERHLRGLLERKSPVDDAGISYEPPSGFDTFYSLNFTEVAEARHLQNVILKPFVETEADLMARLEQLVTEFREVDELKLQFDQILPSVKEGVHGAQRKLHRKAQLAFGDESNYSKFVRDFDEDIVHQKKKLESQISKITSEISDIQRKMTQRLEQLDHDRAQWFQREELLATRTRRLRELECVKKNMKERITPLREELKTRKQGLVIGERVAKVQGQVLSGFEQKLADHLGSMIHSLRTRKSTEERTRGKVVSQHLQSLQMFYQAEKRFRSLLTEHYMELKKGRSAGLLSSPVGAGLQAEDDEGGIGSGDKGRDSPDPEDALDSFDPSMVQAPAVDGGEAGSSSRPSTPPPSSPSSPSASFSTPPSAKEGQTASSSTLAKIAPPTNLALKDIEQAHATTCDRIKELKAQAKELRPYRQPPSGAATPVENPAPTPKKDKPKNTVGGMLQGSGFGGFFKTMRDAVRGDWKD
eukprot:NODE_926_length_1683_cov_14.562424_g759_i0.p1 GENE.NODE_926_length_1683_cov_14.562424_g759_i0~~NODE_926_length_1683_cov_14.562424_g759_i0.p1  ORF type:complete len:548 (-),score=134.91 NODE_926_length_1683_cov_14.562424_g759_i0:39-1487(-)